MLFRMDLSKILWAWALWITRSRITSVCVMYFPTVCTMLSFFHHIPFSVREVRFLLPSLSFKGMDNWPQLFAIKAYGVGNTRFLYRLKPNIKHIKWISCPACHNPLVQPHVQGQPQDFFCFLNSDSPHTRFSPSGWLEPTAQRILKELWVYGGVAVQISRNGCSGISVLAFKCSALGVQVKPFCCSSVL